MWSFASTPGNAFVMPRSSRTGVSSIRGDCMSGAAARGRNENGPVRGPFSRFRAVLEGLRRLDLAGDDLPLELRDLLQDLHAELALELRADLAERDAVVLQVVN